MQTRIEARTVLLLGALALGVLGLGGCRARSAEPPTPPPAVRTLRVEASVPPPLALRGPVVAGSRLRLGFKASGVVKVVQAKIGDVVHKGQMIARLDNADAAARTRSAQVTREQARRELRRVAKLVDDGAVPSATRDDAKSQLDVADANLALALDGLRATQLTAPVDGTVFKRLGEPGETIAAGAPLLIVEETERPVVKLGVTERDLRHLSKGMPATLTIEETGARLAGRVSTVATTPDAADGLYAVEVAPASTPGRLGTLVTVRFDPPAEASIRVPLEALVHRSDKDWVFAVDGPANAAVAHARAIGLGRSEGRDVAVVSGLTGGERIVAEGAYFLVESQAVRVVE